MNHLFGKNAMNFHAALREAILALPDSEFKLWNP